MREADATEQLVPGGEAPQRLGIGKLRAARAQLTETLQSKRGDVAASCHDVGLGLIRLVQEPALGLADERHNSMYDLSHPDGLCTRRAGCAIGGETITDL